MSSVTLPLAPCSCSTSKPCKLSKEAPIIPRHNCKDYAWASPNLKSTGHTTRTWLTSAQAKPLIVLCSPPHRAVAQQCQWPVTDLSHSTPKSPLMSPHLAVSNTCLTLTHNTTLTPMDLKVTCKLPVTISAKQTATFTNHSCNTQQQQARQGMPPLPAPAATHSTKATLHLTQHKIHTGRNLSQHKIHTGQTLQLTFAMCSVTQQSANSLLQKNTLMPWNYMKASNAIVDRSKFTRQESAPGKCLGVRKSIEVENCCSNSKQTLLQIFSTH